MDRRRFIKGASASAAAIACKAQAAGALSDRGRSYEHGRPLREFHYSQIALQDGLHHAQLEQTHSILMGLSEDSLLRPFRVRANLSAPGVDLGGWYSSEERAGLTFGQWVSVPVELVVNGVAVDKVTLLADGTPQSIKFKKSISRSSWIALRILPSGHTHPVFVTVHGKPIRASKRSAQWCRTCVDAVWEVKSPLMRESERPAAAEAFDHARETYDRIIGECEGD